MMKSSTKRFLAAMVILLVILLVVIVVLAVTDTRIKAPEEMGNTVLSEKATETAQPETEAAAEPETETPAAPSVSEIPNDKEVRLYVGGGGVMDLVTEYVSPWSPDYDIAIFEAINSSEQTIYYDDYYTLHESYWFSVQTQTDYKIGYELSFDVDGEHKVYTILDPSDIVNNPDLFMGDAALDEVTGYMGVWVYNDIGQSGTYVHLLPEDMTAGVLMTSIKLRPTPLYESVTNFKLKAFSYSTDQEFNSEGHYIGIHGYEINVIDQNRQ